MIDASAVVDLLLQRSSTRRIEAEIRSELHLHVPHLLDTEVLHALRRWAARGYLGEERAQTALEALSGLPLVRYAHSPLSSRVWALRDRISAYDATYVALAEALDATLLTADGRLARSARLLIPVTNVSGGQDVRSRP